MHTIRRLNLGEAMTYRLVRLEALRDSPAAFASTYESAMIRDDTSWVTQADSCAEGEDRAIFLVLEDGPVGLAALYRDACNPTVGELLQMWVAPSHRGKSVAVELLNPLFQWASVRSFGSIRAEVTPGNLRALRFYQKYGFAVTSSDTDTDKLAKPVASGR